MTKEQEKAIRYVIFMSKTINFDKSGFPYGKESLETVLNMLKEKDKEIQFQKDINKQEKDRHKQAEKSLKGQIKILKRDFKIVDQECSRLERKEEKQDKIIDLMAEWISERCLYIDDYGNSCDITQDICNKRNNCKDCIKQYFKEQSKKEGEN